MDGGASRELMGRTSGCCGGVGGSMHLTDFSRGLIGAFAIVGAGLSGRRRRGAVGEAARHRRGRAGVLRRRRHEHRHLPRGAEHGRGLEGARRLRDREQPLRRVQPARETTPLDDLAERAKAHAMPGVIVDGQDVDAVHDGRRRGGRRAPARGDGPTLLEAKTYRFRGHSRTDPGQVPGRGRARALEAARSDRPARRRARRRRASLDEDEQRALRDEVQAEVDASRRARGRRRPSRPSRRSRPMSTHAEAAGRRRPPATRRAVPTARRSAPRSSDELDDDPTVAAAWARTSRPPAASSRRTRGCSSAFGAERVLNTPICENGFVGVALGMAVTGLRPVVEIMFSDFLPTAGDAIVERAAEVPLHVGRPVQRPASPCARSAARPDASARSTRRPASRGTSACPA